MTTEKTMNRIPTILLCVVMSGCLSDVIEPPRPDTSNPTATLEAKYVTTPPNKISATYWKTAEYLPLSASTQVSGQVPSADGLFNMSGTYNGTASFNKGKDAKISMKAAYTDDSVYVLITWMDTLFNASQSNWFYNGPTDPNKAGSTAGWTSQRADDNLILSFDMGSSKRDLWNWSLALSEPLGFAIDMIQDGVTATADAGNKTYVRNAVSDNRSGPMFDWDGTEQKITRKPAGATILDPGFYLLNKDNYTGDVALGETFYQAECGTVCHGTNGDGDTGAANPVGFALNKPGQFNRWTLVALNTFASDPGQHEGAVHYPVNATDRENLFARLRGFSGIPGYYLQNPSGSSSDIRSVSNVKLGNIETYNKGYQILLIRALNTSQADDIVLNPANATYNFNFSVRDNDMINQIGSTNQILTFKPKAL
jgi:hypothetical protein